MRAPGTELLLATTLSQIRERGKKVLPHAGPQPLTVPARKQVEPGIEHGAVNSGTAHAAPTYAAFKSTLRSNVALTATTIVETLIKTAPTAGESKNPAQARTPAASGIATAL